MTWTEFFVLDYEPKRINTSLLVAVLVATYIFFKWYKHITSPLARIKKVPGWPLVSQVPHLMFTKDECALHVSNVEFAGEEGLYRSLNFDGTYHVGVCKPEYIKQVLVTSSKKYKRPDFFKKSLSYAIEGLFLVEGAEHAWQKKLMNPMFSNESVKCYIDSFKRHCTDVITLWAEKCRRFPSRTAPIVVEHDVSNLTLDIIGDTAFGVNFDTVLSEGTDASKSFTTVINKGMDSIRLILLNSIPYFENFPTKLNLQVNKARRRANNLVKKVIERKRNASEKQVDLLSVLMETRDEDTGKAMSNSTLVNNVWTFIIAGHETTSTCLMWTLYHLACHPEIQDQARKEVQGILENYGQFDSEAVDKLLYVTAVVKESLRVSPPGPMVFRQCIENDRIGNVTIPKGTIIIIPSIGLHHHQKFWREPEKFVPERFLEPDPNWSSGIFGQTYIPFANGSHMCIGYKFALMEIKVIIALLLSNFRFGIDPSHPKVGNRTIFTLKALPSPELQVEYIGT